MSEPRLYISHDSALHYWRTNPPAYVLDGLYQNIRKLQGCPSSAQEARSLVLSEYEFGPCPIDVLVPPNAQRVDGVRLKHHVQHAELPPHALCPLYDGIHVVSQEVCLVQLCATHDILEAFEIGMELCGTYAARPDSIEDKASRDYTLIDAVSFKRHAETWKGLRGLSSARSVANCLVNGSASPMETKLFLLLCLPQKYGGYNFASPELNVEIEVPLSAKEALRQAVVKPDMLWRYVRVVVEYDGAYHDDERQMARDSLRKSILESMGYTVITFKRWHLYNPVVFDEMAEALARKLGKRIRPLTVKQAFARDSLRAQLLAD